MDEIKEAIVNLKIDAKILRTLIDTILDACRLGYGGDLRIYNDEKVFTVIKTFYPDEYNNRLESLKACEVKEGSDSEAEEFKNEPKEDITPVKPSKTPNKAPAADTTGAEMQRLLVELCKDHGLNLNDICKQYKINRNSNSEDIAAAYYDLNNKIMRGDL